MKLTISASRLGTGGRTKTEVCSEKFQTAFDPHPSFSENHIAIFFRKTLFEALNKGLKSAIYDFGLKMTPRPAPSWNFSENSSVLVSLPVP